MDTALRVVVSPAPEAAAIGVRRLAIANFGVAFTAFGVAAGDGHDAGAVAGQPRSAVPQRRRCITCRSPAHGILMALVFTTFFIMGFGYVVAERDARARCSRTAARLGRVLGGARGHAGRRARFCRGQGERAVHVLPAAPGASSVLHRRHAARGRLVGLVAGRCSVAPGLAARAHRRTARFRSRCTACWQPPSSGCSPRSASPPRCWCC